MLYIPDRFSANEAATGLLVKGIKINGHYLIVENCNVFPVQEVDQAYYIQGGPRSAIADIGVKHVEGEISCPVRVDKDGELEPAVIELLKNAQTPATALMIETNHVLSDLSITAENGGTDNNQLLTLDCCVISSLSLSASFDAGVKIRASIIGMIDARQETDIIAPPNGYLLHRQLSFADCDISRYQSDMRTVDDFEIKIDNKVELVKFLMTPGERTDQPALLGVTSCKWGGYFQEVLRRGAEAETFIHGGFMVGENLEFQIGNINATIAVPLFKIGEQPLTANVIKRRTDFFAQIPPALDNNAGDLFRYL